jgi:hypothetical protein
VTLACRGRNTGTFVPGSGPDVVFHWDNIGLDGPVIPALRGYEIPDNTTVSTFTGDAGDPSTPAINLGYLLLDGTTGKAAGICSPINLISSLAFENVNLSGMNTALLTFNAWLNASTAYNDTLHIPTTSWGISYSLNGGPFTTVYLTAAQIAAMTNNTGGLYQGFFFGRLSPP